MNRRATLPDDISEWIDRAMPGLGGIRSVRIFRCARVPFWWLPGFGERFCGLTLWRSIYIHERVGPAAPDNRAWMELLLHELVHVEQFRRRRFVFPMGYLWKLATIGYEKHPDEIEARQRSAQLSAAFYSRRSSGA